MAQRKTTEQLQAEILKEMFEDVLPLDGRFEAYLSRLQRREERLLENA